MTQEQYSFIYSMAEKISEDPEWLDAVIQAAVAGAAKIRREANETKSYVPVIISRADEALKSRGKNLVKILKKGMHPKGFIALGLLRDHYPNWKELPTRKEIEDKI